MRFRGKFHPVVPMGLLRVNRRQYEVNYETKREGKREREREVEQQCTRDVYNAHVMC